MAAGGETGERQEEMAKHRCLLSAPLAREGRAQCPQTQSPRLQVTRVALSAARKVNRFTGKKKTPRSLSVQTPLLQLLSALTPLNKADTLSVSSSPLSPSLLSPSLPHLPAVWRASGHCPLRLILSLWCSSSCLPSFNFFKLIYWSTPTALGAV